MSGRTNLYGWSTNAHNLSNKRVTKTALVHLDGNEENESCLTTLDIFMTISIRCCRIISFETRTSLGHVTVMTLKAMHLFTPVVRVIYLEGGYFPSNPICIWSDRVTRHKWRHPEFFGTRVGCHVSAVEWV